MHRRVVPGLPVMMVLGDALQKQAQARRAKAEPAGTGGRAVADADRQATPPASRAA